MNINRRFLYWGIFLLAAGGALLVGQGHALDGDGLGQALRFWPVVPIALGVALLVRRTRFGLAGGMVAAAMPGLLLGGLVVAAPRAIPTCGTSDSSTVVTRQGTFDGAASVDFTLACGELFVTTAPGNGWQLQAGDASLAAATIDASPGRLAVASRGTARPFSFDNPGETWRLALPTSNTLDLNAEIDAGRGRFDLAGARLGNVQIAVNAADAHVDLSGATVGHLLLRVNAAAAGLLLPTTQDISADIDVSAGGVKLCAASDVGLRIRSTTVLSSANYTGLVRDGELWESPGYAMANHHADVTITANVGSVDVNPQGGCQ